ncbi:hypothetical protein PPYR_08011 [Photinus pyralis]|uniref:Saposin n=1 Tax=Photinus pyralis TaxID=7054 RepID=A0A1Y1LZ62_PHOPY|nr:prosaposin [Photinus pyralis]KAB0800131.1 hypothetical protein PPYR_08011 [Photinus pyralis]
MKTLFLLASIALLVTLSQSTTTTEEPIVNTQRINLLGSKECTYGPAFWCKSLINSAQCRATKHCIQTVWIHQKLPPDHSSICETCLKMVKEARDQLLSNETQEEIKEVFEGSCKLIPISIVAKECCRIADEFAPELIDTLASQMNPQIVCSVAGLCNSERVHDLIAEDSKVHAMVSKRQKPLNTCEGCYKVIEIVEKNFRQASRDQILQTALQICGKLGSLSDACSNLILNHFNELYNHINANLNPEQFCLMSGECKARFHTHANVEITPLANTGVIHVSGDELPCELCKQLVHHLQDVLVANTTENEFRMVLKGICKQTHSFKDECLSLVDQYFTEIYNFIANELDAGLVCSVVRICPGPGLQLSDAAPIFPLLPTDTKNPLEDTLELLPPEILQLPIERVVPQTLTSMGNTQLCEFCTYFLKFVQQAITDPITQEKLEHIVDGACERLPSTIRDECKGFVETYGPAFIAILAQDIDPSTVCPKLSLCPSIDIYKVHNVEVFTHSTKSAKPKCALCLLAITSLEEVIKNKRTEEAIRKGLKSLCSHLHGVVADECNDFVETYTDEVVELLLKDLSAQDICIYFKLCQDQVTTEAPKREIGRDIETNQIIDYTANGKVIANVERNVDADVCLICEFLMSEVQNKLKDNATEEEVKELLNKVCNSFSSKYIKTHCLDFVRQYEDVVIQLLINSLSPADVCKALHLCKDQEQIPQVTDLMIDYERHKPLNVPSVKSPQCTLCKVVMLQIEKMLNGSVDEAKILKTLEEVCKLVPHEEQKCDQFIEKYGKQILTFLEYAMAPAEFCSIVGLCSTNVLQLQVRKCAVCEVVVDIVHKILENPNIDHSISHVFEKACKAVPTKNQDICRGLVAVFGDRIINLLASLMEPVEVCQKIRFCGSHSIRPHEQTLLGRTKCTRGPGYWCQSEATATECGAMEHCKKNIWSQITP